MQPPPPAPPKCTTTSSTHAHTRHTHSPTQLLKERLEGLLAQGSGIQAILITDKGGVVVGEAVKTSLPHGILERALSATFSIATDQVSSVLDWLTEGILDGILDGCGRSGA